MNNFNKTDKIICYCAGLTIRKLEALILANYSLDDIIREKKAMIGCKNCNDRLKAYYNLILKKYEKN